MANLATKPSSRDDGLLYRLAISTNMLHKSVMNRLISQTYHRPASNRRPSGLCSMFFDMEYLANKPSSCDDGLVARLAISI